MIYSVATFLFSFAAFLFYLDVLRDHSGQKGGGMWNARITIQVGHLQGKCPTHHTTAPGLTALFLRIAKSYFEENSRTFNCIMLFS